jgi:hypothetical protein
MWCRYVVSESQSLTARDPSVAYRLALPADGD